MTNYKVTVNYNTIIIGGGAAGFFAAINAARMSPEKTVAILEKSTKVLSKVRVSGGGRCNVTHACFDDRELVKFYPRGGKELRGAFSRFSVRQTIGWFRERGVELKTESDGRMFPVSNTSETIVDCLFSEAKKHKVEILMQRELREIEATADGFLLSVNENEKISCNRLIIAAGGNAKPAGYDFIMKTGHTIIPPVPSLFTFNMPGNKVSELMGVSVEHATVKIEGTAIKTEGPLLITHWGMSGPAVLKASAWGARELAERNYHFTAAINWLGEKKEEDVYNELIRSKIIYNAQMIVSSNPFQLVKRLWQFLVIKAGADTEMRWADLSNKLVRKLAQVLVNDRYEVKGKTTFKEEFVTCGGIKLSEIDFKTMESRKQKGLFFVGEVLDIDGVTGGFNFQSAWTTAWIAACGTAE
ncbi:MAG: NAD(P)/FAD-dependent oxidoreductase [Bacteroidota bacterium]|nr:NAD(P)/FAD-dependent oxidoreductase [Bacteroidota bacterium]